uniref:Ovule protein n=1 Tax=Taenia asiatica TaxID=60517 RepID=A0A0R3WF03_TAEAS
MRLLKHAQVISFNFPTSKSSHRQFARNQFYSTYTILKCWASYSPSNCTLFSLLPCFTNDELIILFCTKSDYLQAALFRAAKKKQTKLLFTQPA